MQLDFGSGPFGLGLVVKVWLAVGGDSYVPTSVLAEKSSAILRATRAAAPTARRAFTRRAVEDRLT